MVTVSFKQEAQMKIRLSEELDKRACKAIANQKETADTPPIGRHFEAWRANQKRIRKSTKPSKAAS